MGAMPHSMQRMLLVMIRYFSDPAINPTAVSSDTTDPRKINSIPTIKTNVLLGLCIGTGCARVRQHRDAPPATAGMVPIIKSNTSAATYFSNCSKYSITAFDNAPQPRKISNIPAIQGKAFFMQRMSGDEW